MMRAVITAGDSEMALNAAILKDLEKRYGEDTFAQTSGKPKDRPFVSTGSILLDAAIGIGGVPLEGLTEIAGKFSAGKTTFALEMCREIQQRTDMPGKTTAVFFDAEHALDLKYAKKIDVDTKDARESGKFLLVQNNCAEEVFDMAMALIEDPSVGIIVIDSVAACLPKKQIEDPEADEIGMQARCLAPRIAKLAAKSQTFKVPVILLNQVRTKFEGTGRFMKATEETPGGNALRFYCLVRIWLTTCGKIMGKGKDPQTGKEIDVKLANVVRAEVIKNKVGPPYRKVELVIRYGVGIDNLHSVIELAKVRNVIKFSRTGHYEFEGTNGFSGRGTENLRKDLEGRPESVQEIVRRVNLEQIFDSDIEISGPSSASEEGGE